MDIYRKILVPLDGSPKSETALPVACEFATCFGAQLHLLAAFDISTALFLGKDDSLPVDLKKLKEHQRKQVELYLRERKEALESQGISPTCSVQAEDPREAICKYASQEEIDLIIMNSGGRSGWMRWLTGSIAEEVLQHAPCPVLILRQTTT